MSHNVLTVRDLRNRMRSRLNPTIGKTSWEAA
jgi:hypothetical protein